MAKQLSIIEQAIVSALTFDRGSYRDSISANDLMIKRMAYVKSTTVDLMRLYDKEVKKSGCNEATTERLLGLNKRLFSLLSQALSMALLGSMASSQVVTLDDVRVRELDETRRALDCLLLSIAKARFAASQNVALQEMLDPIIVDATIVYDLYPKLFGKLQALTKSEELSTEARNLDKSQTDNNSFLAKALIRDVREESLDELIERVKNNAQWYLDASITLAEETDEEETEDGEDV